MGRKRVYANAAERQRAHRTRAAMLDRPQTPSNPKAGCPPRVAAIENEIRAVLADCESWLASWPEPIKGSVRADLLTEAIGVLSDAADALASIHPGARSAPP